MRSLGHGGLAVLLLAVLFLTGFTVDRIFPGYRARVVRLMRPPTLRPAAGTRMNAEKQLTKTAWRRAARRKADGYDSDEAPVLLIGNSITEFWTRQGRDIWKRRIEPAGVHNLGLYGDRIENVLYRLREFGLPDPGARTVVLMIGTNNLLAGHAPRNVVAGILRLIRELRSPGVCPDARIVVYGLPPMVNTVRPDEPHDLLPEVKAVNAALAAEIGERFDAEEVHYLSIYDALVKDAPPAPDEPRPADPDCFSDHVHLSETGYRLWARSLARHIQRIPERPTDENPDTLAAAGGG